MEDNSYDRMAREIGRLHLLGADFTDAIRAAIEWTYQRLEFGWTHAYAGAADWLTLYDEHVDDPETQLICILESVAHIADDTLRESKYPYSEDRQEFNEQAFLAAIETCDENHAQALLRGAVAQGLHFVDLERLLSQAALAHYNDFGHALIYVTKAGKLIDRLGAEVELPLLQALVRSLAFSSREDLIPEFRGYADALQNWNSRNESQTPSWQAFQSLTINKALKQTVAFSGASSISRLPHCSAPILHICWLTICLINIILINKLMIMLAGYPLPTALRLPMRCANNAPDFRSCGRQVYCNWRVFVVEIFRIRTTDNPVMSGWWTTMIRFTRTALTSCLITAKRVYRIRAFTQNLAGRP